MEVHKPKPWRGAREFLREYLIIVVGVLTALGGETAVGWLHQRAEVADARKLLRADIAHSASMARFTFEAERCRRARLDLYVTWANGGAHPPKAGNAGFLQPGTSTWEVVKAGAAAHMPIEERVAYARFYDLVQIVIENDQVEVSQYLLLAGLNSKAALTPAEAQSLLVTAGQARIIGTVRTSNALSLLGQAKAMGVEPGPMSVPLREQLEIVCRSAGVGA